MSESKYWCFTSFNSDFLENFKDTIQSLIDNEELTYCVCQIETCPNTNKEHLQGYAIFPKKKRIQRVKSIFGIQDLHLEKRRGDHKQAKAYCMKDESRRDGPFEFGDDSDYEGTRKRKLEDVKIRIDEGTDEVTIADEFFPLWCRYYRSFSQYKMLKSRSRDFKTEVRVYYGPPGTGKSRRATYEAGPSAYRKPLGEWWDGYDGVSNVIIDDYYGWIRFDELLRCLDRYGHRVPIKGGFVNFAPKLLILTSNVEPRKWYSEERISDLRFEALKRRLDLVELMEDFWEEPITEVGEQLEPQP